MSTWKKLNQQDVSISTYNAQKEWTVSSIEMVDYGIRVYPAYSGSVDILNCSLTLRGEFISFLNNTPTPTATPTPIDCSISIEGVHISYI